MMFKLDLIIKMKKLIHIDSLKESTLADSVFLGLVIFTLLVLIFLTYKFLNK